MKLKEVFKPNRQKLDTRYYQSSFDSTDYDVDDDIRSQIFMPGHLTIEPEDTVSLATNRGEIMTAPWKDIVEYLQSNWEDLSGTYFITDGNRVLHRFRIA